MRVTDYSVNRIRILARAAERGNTKALNELQKLNVYIVNNITRREKTITKKGVRSPALTRFYSMLEKVDMEYPSKSKKLTVEQLYNQVLAGRRFLASKTGTAKGALKWEKDEMSRLAKRGINLTTDQFSNEWSDFMDSDIVQEYKKFDSPRALLDLSDAIQRGRTMEDLEKAWEKYQTKKSSLPEAWKEFITIPKGETTPFSD